jgi:uncharacterized membrane protein
MLEYKSWGFPVPDLQERQYKITYIGILQRLGPFKDLNAVELDILNYLNNKKDWIDFSSILDQVRYISKWTVSCILSYLISLGYVQERIYW